MEPFKDLNKISPAWEAEIEKFRPEGSESVKFRLKCGHPNLDVETKGKTPTLWPASFKIPGADTVQDPFTKKRVMIGVVDYLDPVTGIPTFKSKVITPKRSDGYFHLYADSHEDMAMFDYLMCCSHNGSNPHRDKSKPEMFEMINEAELMKKRYVEIKGKMAATQLLTDMEIAQKRNIAVCFGINEEQDEETLTTQLFDRVEADPQAFTDTFNNKNLEMKAFLGRAITKGIIGFIPEENKMQWNKGGEVFAQLSRTEGKSVIDALTEWCLTSKNGQEVYNTIKGQVNPKPAKK